MRAAYLLPLLAVLGYCADKVQDQVSSLPGVIFEVNFKHYSGYLDATSTNHLHYWLFESQTTPATAPLILWLNGSPSSNAVSGPLKENGPFHPTSDGEHLQENVFSWNKVANVLYIDSPVCSGSSYSDNGDARNNEKTVQDLISALQKFVAAYPEYKSRDFFITGEQYGGIYVSELVKKLIETPTSVDLKLQGFAIGNGLLRFSDSFNANLDLLYYRGIISKHDFDSLFDCCTASLQEADLLYCDFSYFIDISDKGVRSPKAFTNDQTLSDCAAKVYKLGNDLVFNSKNSPFNTYQDCYDNAAKAQRASYDAAKTFQNHQEPFYDQGANQYATSTDSMDGFQCYVDDAIRTYIRKPEVQQALHISLANQCSGDYAQTEWDMTDVFTSIIASGTKVRGLIYNGDMDLTSSFLANQWFVDRIGSKNEMKAGKREEWLYKRTTKSPPVGGGYIKQYTKGSVGIDLVQVKGAGLFATVDRPGPSLTMITNFINAKAYNTVPSFAIDAAPLLKDFQAAPVPELSRKEADRIFDLPGVTFKVNFNQYAGYLNGIKGDYLHYWFVESQRDPANDPLVLWLSGGPGCSGYTALLWGNGPFRPNRDSTTLFENKYSWNKIANVIFIDSPRGVGFSFQNTTENPSQEWSDELSAEDLKLAIIDFLDVYPEYKNRPFFLAGESYGGIYAPMTAAKLIDMIQSGDLAYLNFQGMATANAMLDYYDNVNAQIQYQYFHGAIGKADYDSLQECCKKSDHPGDNAYFEFCDFARQYLQFDEQGNMVPKDDGICGKKTIDMSTNSVYGGPQTQFNLYASCYDLYQNPDKKSTEPPSWSNDRPELVKPFYKDGFVDQARLVSHEASDSQDGLFCWGQPALKKYMALPAVQAALHVYEPERGQVAWTGCSDQIGSAYKSQQFDMRPYFKKIIEWGKPFKFLIYNGDVDMTCNFLSGQWFAESLAEEQNMTLAKDYAAWHYLTEIGGYTEQFKFGDHISMDVVTVKGAGHFAALDRPGPTLQVFASLIDNQPLETKAKADVALQALLDRYQVEEEAGREKDLPSAAASRAKRATLARELPAPPPACNKKDNEIIDLPGLTFDLGSKQYSGYLNAGTGDYLHYWFIEAATDPANAPLIMWFNGGPGCSSLTGLLSELGPFHNNPDGATLYENIFSWHKTGNLLFFESPRGVGFSYQANDKDPNLMHDYNDDLTADGNVEALLDFLNCHPEYKNRRLFISGESYSGVYIPTFVDALLKRVANGTADGVNLEGLAIGNGEFSALKDLSSAVSLTYMRGMHSKAEFLELAECVDADWDKPMSFFDFTKYVHYNELGEPIPNSFNKHTLEGRCGTALLRQGFTDVWQSRNDVYNTYQDCYAHKPEKAGKQGGRRVKRDAIGRPMKYQPFVDEAKRMNYDSTDNNGGLYCFDGKTPYLNRKDVRTALNIPEYFTTEWEECSNHIYNQQHQDTTPVFESIFDTLKELNKPLRFLIYHGDTDMACQFLAGQWFIEELAENNQMTNTRPFAPWQYGQVQKSMMQNIGGFQKSWTHMDGKVTFDLLTVKGAGHMVQMDRAGEALQMMYNFVHNYDAASNSVDYEKPLWKSFDNFDPKPLKPEYLVPPKSIMSRADADRVYDLPGLTYDLTFKQWAGYLQAGKGDKLFYWFFESQNTDPSTPVLLWLNGGPGCSSLIGLLTENGPFRVNPDQRTLWENVYSWNKAAHVVYIDSPKQVGFSWQNKTENTVISVSDDDIAPDAYLALEDFFTIFPEMKKRDFYTSGESYCGVYLPLITAYLTEKIDAKESTINLKGMIIGNGQVSFKQDMRSSPSFNYMHGIVDKAEYDTLADCCIGNDTLGGLYCEYDEFFRNAIYELPKADLDENGKKCAEAYYSVSGAQGEEWSDTNDAYNLYQDCYTSPKSLLGLSQKSTSYKSRILSLKLRNRMAAAAAAAQGEILAADALSWGDLDPTSTDNTKGYQCWMDDATIAYLRLAHVRTALHVPDYVQQWNECATLLYTRNKDDMSPQFEALMNSPLNLRVLLYNGDIDDVCHLMQAQWFVETLAHKHEWTESEKTEWNHRGVIAGYQTSYKASETFSLDLLTVKGAGHMVPTDRPGPALQMIDAFLKQKDYNTAVPYSMERKPLLEQYSRHGAPAAPTSTVTVATTTTTKPTVPTAPTVPTVSTETVPTVPTVTTVPTVPTVTSTPSSTTKGTSTTSGAAGIQFASLIALIFAFALFH